MTPPTPKEQTLLLKKITFIHTPRIPGLRADAVFTLDLDNPAPSLIGWNVVLTSNTLALVSPRGYLPSNATMPLQRNPNGPVEIHTIPRSDVIAHFVGNPEDVEAACSGKRYETGPIGIKKVVVDESKSLLAQIPASQLGDA